jgi:F-type H+-transporting ATPase subunit b
MKGYAKFLTVMFAAGLVAALLPAPRLPAADESPGAAAGAEAHGAGEHGAGEHGAGEHGGLDPDLAIVTAIIFLVLLAVLGKFAWGPITEALDQREKAIADEIASAERQNGQARALLAEHEAKLAGTADEVRRLLEEARRDADQQRQQILAEAQAAAADQKDRAVREIEGAKNAALQELAQTSVNTAVDLAGQIVQRQLSADDHAALIGDALNRFPSQN